MFVANLLARFTKMVREEFAENAKREALKIDAKSYE